MSTRRRYDRPSSSSSPGGRTPVAVLVSYLAVARPDIQEAPAGDASEIGFETLIPDLLVTGESELEMN